MPSSAYTHDESNLGAKARGIKRQGTDADPDADPDADAPVITDSAVWSKGDFALVSADNVRFRIDHHYLLSASSVFRDLASAATSDSREIHFTDWTMERSSTIGHFLELITDGTIHKRCLADVEPMVYLGKLLDKYDCLAAMKLFKLFLLSQLQDDLAAECLVVAAALDDMDLCAKCFDTPPGSQWVSEDLVDEASEFDFYCSDNPAYAYPRFHPQTLPWIWARHIPSDYLWALNRAWIASQNEDKDMGDMFKQFLRVARRESVARFKSIC
ncbi:hypothetical protein Q8F55_002752 [Vanrija albida]|uniref:BTB domain-containing protein n=1 Tax=Vanrija albida TaxID=181172 RepID=A0ABR3QAV6_9TREE